MKPILLFGSREDFFDHRKDYPKYEHRRMWVELETFSGETREIFKEWFSDENIPKNIQQ